MERYGRTRVDKKSPLPSKKKKSTQNRSISLISIGRILIVRKGGILMHSLGTSACRLALSLSLKSVSGALKIINCPTRDVMKTNPSSCAFCGLV